MILDKFKMANASASLDDIDFNKLKVSLKFIIIIVYLIIHLFIYLKKFTSQGNNIYTKKIKSVYYEEEIKVPTMHTIFPKCNYF